MTTLLLAPELFLAEGGITRMLRLYLKGLCDLAHSGDDVRLVVLNDAQLDSAESRRYSNDRLSEWAMCGRSRTRFVRAALSASRDADLLICGHVAQLPVAWMCRRANPRLRYVLVAHGIEVWRRFNPLEKLALRGADRVLCVSDYTRRELLRHSGLPHSRALVLHNALDPHLVPAAPASRNGTILAVSRLSAADAYKGIDHLIQAMPAIRRVHPDAELRIIGRGDDLPRLQTLAGAGLLDGSIRFLGYVGDSELLRELGACRLFALPSEREGFGLVYLEAMAHGKPCVAADAGGAPEVVTPDVGLLAPYGDVPLLAERCSEALSREWDDSAIQARACSFSYSAFRDRLKSLLAA